MAPDPQAIRHSLEMICVSCASLLTPLADDKEENQQNVRDTRTSHVNLLVLRLHNQEIKESKLRANDEQIQS